MDEILELIKTDIEWYNGKAKTATIDELSKLKTHLVTLNYNLAEGLADMKEAYNKAYFVRKIETSKQKNAYINQGQAANKAESAALEDKEKELQDELTKESLAYRIEILLKQSNKVVEDITQRISILKTEKNYSGQI